MIHEGAVTQQILEFVNANPGATRQDVLEGVSEANPNTVGNLLAHLQRQGAIENRGGSVNRWNPAKWYPTSDIPADDPYRILAQELLSELKNVHHANREVYLASRLRDLINKESNS